MFYLKVPLGIKMKNNFISLINIFLCLCILTLPSLSAIEWPQRYDQNWNVLRLGNNMLMDLNTHKIYFCPQQNIVSSYPGSTVADTHVNIANYANRPLITRPVNYFDVESSNKVISPVYKYRGVLPFVRQRPLFPRKNNQAYSFGTRGNLYCIDLKTGQILWI